LFLLGIHGVCDEDVHALSAKIMFPRRRFASTSGIFISDFYFGIHCTLFRSLEGFGHCFSRAKAHSAAPFKHCTYIDPFEVVHGNAIAVSAGCLKTAYVFHRQARLQEARYRLLGMQSCLTREGMVGWWMVL
jgi:hypothetical protein